MIKKIILTLGLMLSANLWADINSYIKGEFNGWQGYDKTIVELQNGQVWVQNQAHISSSISIGSPVKIYIKNGMYYMQIPNEPMDVIVRRIR